MLVGAIHWLPTLVSVGGLQLNFIGTCTTLLENQLRKSTPDPSPTFIVDHKFPTSQMASILFFLVQSM